MYKKQKTKNRVEAKINLKNNINTILQLKKAHAKSYFVYMYLIFIRNRAHLDY